MAVSRPVVSRRREVGGGSARSLLTTVLGEFVLPYAKPVWTATLVDVLALFGVEEKAARQALARTAAEGWLSSDRVGRRVRWSLTRPGRRLLAEGAERIYGFGSGERRWDGRWLVLLVSVPETMRDLRHKLRTRLSWAGFGSPTAGVWITPHPGAEADAKLILDELDLSGQAMSFLANYGALGQERDMVASAWNLTEVAERYDAFIAEFAGLSPGHAGRRAARADPAGARVAPLPVPGPAAPGRPAPAEVERHHGNGLVQRQARPLAHPGPATLDRAGQPVAGPAPRRQAASSFRSVAACTSCRSDSPTSSVDSSSGSVASRVARWASFASWRAVRPCRRRASKAARSAAIVARRWRSRSSRRRTAGEGSLTAPPPPGQQLGWSTAHNQVPSGWRCAISTVAPPRTRRVDVKARSPLIMAGRGAPGSKRGASATRSS